MITGARKRLGVVGGGIAGLVSARFAKEEGLDVTVFEKRPVLGGNWNPVEGQIWPDLVANISKFYTQFIDFTWSEVEDNFPTKTNMYRFISHFVNEFGIEDSVRFNSEVFNVKINADKVLVTYMDLNTQESVEETFDFLFISTGNYDKPDYLHLEKYLNKSNNSKVEIIHSSQYKYPEHFRNKRVMVVGNANSGVQIAADICKSAKEVVNVYRTKVWVIPKDVYSNEFKKVIPHDIQNIRLKNFLEISTVNNKKNLQFSSISSQNEVCTELFIDVEGPFPGVSICDTYVKDVKKGLIKPVVATVDKIEGNHVFLNDGQIFETDVVIMCTGFKRDYLFLDEEIRKVIEYRPEVKYMNVNLYKTIFHPKIPNIAFLAIPRGFFCIWELQVKLAMKLVIHKKFRKSEEKMLREICDNARSKSAFKNSSEYFFKLVEELELMPNFPEIQVKDPELYDYIINGPFIPQCLGLSSLDTKLSKKCADYIKRLNHSLRQPHYLAKF